jgi:mannosyltransferase
MLKKLFKYKYFTEIFLVITLSLASIISILYFIPESLRLDESQSIIQSNRPFPELVESLARDVHMPLYATLLHVWINIFGNNIPTSRFLSLLFFLLSICVWYFFTLDFTKKRRIAVYSTLLFTFSPFLQWFGSELRMYSLFTLLTLCLHYFFFKIFYVNKGNLYNWLGYTFFVIAGIYTHYLFFLFLFCQVVYLLFNMQLFDIKKRWQLLYCFAFSALLFVPWLWYVNKLNTAGSQAPLLAKPTTSDLFNLYSNSIFGFQSDSLNTSILATWPLVGFFSTLLLQKRVTQIKLKHYYLVTMAFLPTFILFVVSLTVRPIFLSRYLIMCLPPLYLLITLILFSFPNNFLKNAKHVFLSLIIFSLIVQINDRFSPVKEDYRGVINEVIAQASPEDVVATTAPFTIFPFEYYYNGSAKLVTLPNWDRKNSIPQFSESKVSEELKGLAQVHKKLYLVSSYDQGYEKNIESLVSSKLDFERKKEFPRIKLSVFSFRR